MNAGASESFTPAQLPAAIQWLFEANGYNVTGPTHVNGAEIDLIATSIGGLRATNIYIEATVEHVDTAKYGKDLTKLAMFANEPGAQRIIVSSRGFTQEVRERASAVGIDTYTYGELFSRFERTEPYIDHVLGDSPLGLSLANLDEIYEEPLFQDARGTVKATKFLNDWLHRDSTVNPWLVVVGEYGTGKTALTQVLQRRWAQAYRSGENTPLPFRLELRDFTRQFDARGLLHHFMDRNQLSHMSVEFVDSMIARGRVVLLLDGYDEMAQYLNVRERRACLAALAELASGGARGILTSRPNYFTEAEELRVYEVLYQQLSRQQVVLKADETALDGEKRIDNILDRFLVSRQERTLKDLDVQQTEALVSRQLRDDATGAALVVGLLRRVFRSTHDSGEQSLGGKPVIISYLLDVVNELKSNPNEHSRVRAATQGATLSEWDIFSIILDNLMLRDYRRVPELLPSDRQGFLSALALKLAREHKKYLNDDEFSSFVKSHFKSLIQRRTIEGASDYTTALIDDLRSSSTLTRSTQTRTYSWGFSHNSLREFLLTGSLLGVDHPGTLVETTIALTDSMLMFARSMPASLSDRVTSQLSALWPSRRTTPGLDQLLSLCWHNLVERNDRNARAALASVAGERLDIAGARLTLLDFKGAPSSRPDLRDLSATGVELSECDLSYVDATNASLDGAVLDACVLRGSSLAGASARGLFMLDCDVTDLRAEGADLTRLDPDSTAFISEAGTVRYLSGDELLGYFRFRGAKTDAVNDIHAFRHHPFFDIADQVLTNLGNNRWSQRHGIEQRGASQKNVEFARKLVSALIAEGLVEPKGGAPSLIGPTGSGREMLVRYKSDDVDPLLSGLLSDLMDVKVGD